MEKIKQNKKKLLMILFAFLLGAVAMVAFRFLTLENKEVHYHANFAVFVEGERLPFDNFTFYEEIAACGGNGIDSPKIRVHMHDQINHVAHVHDNGVSWGHFFANLGYANGDSVFKTDESVYIEDDDTEIRFILNGEEVQTTANRTIGDEDVLLVSVGKPSADELKDQYGQIKQDADFYNQNDDPSACSGGTPYSLTERLKTPIGIGE
jgi:hypothetical protein